MAEKEKDLLMSVYGGSAFLKIKQALEIGKVCFSFVDIKEPKNHIDIYMDAVEFATEIAHECGLETNERLFRALKAEKDKGDQYPKAVYVSPVGGNATGNNGKPISRYFEISPAAQKGDVLFTAKAFPAEKNATGAFIAKKGEKALLTLRVPCLYKDLKGMALKWKFLEEDYMRSVYTVAGMKSEYGHRPADIDEQTITMITMPSEEEPAPATKQATQQEEKPAEKVPDLTEIEVRTTALLIENGDNYKLAAIDKGNKNLEFTLPKKYFGGRYGKVGDQFLAKASKEDGIMCHFSYYVFKEKKIIYKIGK